MEELERALVSIGCGTRMAPKVSGWGSDRMVHSGAAAFIANIRRTKVKLTQVVVIKDACETKYVFYDPEARTKSLA